MELALVTVLLSAATLLCLAVVMAYLLGAASKALHVPVDVRIAQVHAALPGANCGGCDYVGCSEYAEAVVVRREAITKCPVGGAATAQQVADIMDTKLEEAWPVRPIVHCAAMTKDRLQQFAYLGEQTCNAANIVAGVQGCVYGCLGLGDCVRACDYDAIHVVDGVAKVDYEPCIGCGACAKECPRNIISMTPFKSDQILAVLCANKDFGKDVLQVCKVGCTGCKNCQKASDGLITVQDNLPSINYQKYSPLPSLRVIQEKCSRESLVWVGKPSLAQMATAPNEDKPGPLKADFKTTVDQTEWRG